MLNKIGKIIRKAHRYLTPLFIIVTVFYMFVVQVPILNVFQRVLMLTMAATGAYLYIQIYVNRYKSSQRKKASKS